MVEREKVLEVDFIKVNDEWSIGVITYQNTNVLERGKFGDRELKINSACDPCYSNETSYFYIRGDEEEYDNRPFEIRNKDVAELQERIEKLNDKYGIKKRWRAKHRISYYYINSYLEVDSEPEMFDEFDRKRYEIGNYFQTREEAEAKRDKIFKVLEEE